MNNPMNDYIKQLCEKIKKTKKSGSTDSSNATTDSTSGINERERGSDYDYPKPSKIIEPDKLPDNPDELVQLSPAATSIINRLPPKRKEELGFTPPSDNETKGTEHRER